jgi:glutaredoxin
MEFSVSFPPLPPCLSISFLGTRPQLFNFFTLFMKIFFKLLRLVLGPLMLLKERLTRPQGIVRAHDAQQRTDAACQNLVLYQFKTCPFCIKVRQELSRLSLQIELRDAQHSPEHRETLLANTGKTKVPCLKIMHADGSVQWMLDSKAIIGYLGQEFA